MKSGSLGTWAEQIDSKIKIPTRQNFINDIIYGMQMAIFING